MYKKILSSLLSIYILSCNPVINAKGVNSKLITVSNKIPAFIEYSSNNVCPSSKKNTYITPLNLNKNSNLNDGTFYGIMKDGNKNYSIKLVLNKNYFESLEVYDNTLSLGLRGNTKILNFSCSMLSITSDLTKDKNLCNLNHIFSYNNNYYDDLKYLCSNNNRNPNIRPSYYLGNKFSNYLLINGFNIDFINQLIKYKNLKNHGLLDF